MHEKIVGAYCLKDAYPHIEDENASITSFHVDDDAVIWYGHKNRNFTLSGVAARTRTWCKLCHMSDEQTMLWLLKYGDVLPTYVIQLSIDIL